MLLGIGSWLGSSLYLGAALALARVSHHQRPWHKLPLEIAPALSSVAAPFLIQSVGLGRGRSQESRTSDCYHPLSGQVP